MYDMYGVWYGFGKVIVCVLLVERVFSMCGYCVMSVWYMCGVSVYCCVVCV